jgi:hypothetical protein
VSSATKMQAINDYAAQGLQALAGDGLSVVGEKKKLEMLGMTKGKRRAEREQANMQLYAHFFGVVSR